MGSFNVSCGLSHISINNGDDAVFIPLYKSYDLDMFNNFRCYPHDDFTPGFLPLKGVYNDYGRLKIDDDAHYDFLNHTLPYEFSDVFESSHDRKKHEFSEDMPSNGMFVSGPVYKYLSTHIEDEYDEYTYENIIKSYGESFDVYYEDLMEQEKAVEYIHHGDKKKVLKYQSTWIMNALHMNYESPGYKFKRYFDEYHTGRRGPFVMRYTDFILRDKDIAKKLFLEFIVFNINMMRQNFLYYPSESGTQCGEPIAKLKFLQECVKIQKNLIKKHDRY